MRRLFIAFAIDLLSALPLMAQLQSNDSLSILDVEKTSKDAHLLEFNTKAVKLVPYGFIRNDFYYDSRENFETANGLFYIVPKDENFNILGEDLNDFQSTKFLSIATRFGLKAYAQHPILGSSLMAQVETDFAGNSTNTFIFRIRQAFARMSWQKFVLTAGQTWHPFFGEVVPTVQSLATGSPFQPFNRSPQLRLDWKLADFRISLAALYQFQYTTWGPNGASSEYMTKGKMPELFVGFDWKKNGWNLGAGADLLRIRPRVSTEINSKTDSAYTISVDESVSSYSFVAFAQYMSKDKKLAIKAKSILGSNMSHLLLLSGYGVSNVLPDGSYEYTNLKNSTSWVNITYGKKWQVGFFAGFMKNLGSDEALYSDKTTYVFGYNNLDYVYRLSPMICLNINRWSFGLEYEQTAAGYGTLDLKSGKVTDSHKVTNHRAVGVAMFNF